MLIHPLVTLHSIQNLTDYKKYFILSSLLMALYTAWTWKQQQQHCISKVYSPSVICRDTHFSVCVMGVSCFFTNKSIFSKKNKLQRFSSTRGKDISIQDKKTCSLETTWTGPMFTDTYLPLADNFCFTRPCNIDVNVQIIDTLIYWKCRCKILIY